MNTLPYQKHSETSKEAAEDNTTSLSVRGKIFGILVQADRRGVIADELKPMFPESARVQTRLKELCDLGQVVKLDKTRETSYGRNANIYIAKIYQVSDDKLATEKTIDHKKEAAEDLYQALVMVRDADNDFKSEGNIGIPGMARIKIDKAIEKAEGKL